VAVAARAVGPQRQRQREKQQQQRQRGCSAPRGAGGSRGRGHFPLPCVSRRRVACGGTVGSAGGVRERGWGRWRRGLAVRGGGGLVE